MKHFFLFLIFLFAFSVAQAIEVSGHITSDTTWSPENNPYIVVDDVMVAVGVTLTILPGTEVKLTAAPLNNPEDHINGFRFYNGTNIAKMIWVTGSLIAEGTAENPITFTRLQNENDYYWGLIYFSEYAEMCRLIHCNISYAAGMEIQAGGAIRDAVELINANSIVRECTFLNCTRGVGAWPYHTEPIEVSHCTFNTFALVSAFIRHLGAEYHVSISEPAEGFTPPLIANNFFTDGRLEIGTACFAQNRFYDGNGINIGGTTCDQAIFFWGNEFNGLYNGIWGGWGADSLYIKNNRFLPGNGTIGINVDINYGSLEIRDNYLDGYRIIGPNNTYRKGILSNNTICNVPVEEAISGGFEEIYNNVVTNCSMVGSILNQNNIFASNLFINNDELCDYFANNAEIANTIMLQNNVDEIVTFGPVVIRNCIIDFPLEPPLVDGGGNIIVDSLQAQSIFEDIQNGDFHLVPGSMAIDAGFNAPTYYPFDLDYNPRVWDGDGDGMAIIDIGPYEYCGSGASPVGKISGITWNPANGEVVDYVLLKIDDNPAEFTFSDSSGCYEIPLPAGTYNVHARRLFYEDAVEYAVEVIDGEITQLDIAMGPTVEAGEEPHAAVPGAVCNLRNYPNPFKPAAAGRGPATEIQFSLSGNQYEPDEQVIIDIFNVKGQKVKTIDVTLSLSKCGTEKSNSPSFDKLRMTRAGSCQSFSVTWDGTDSSNRPVASGVYLYRILIDGKPQAQSKMMLMK
jgi:hypothetical protein